jgi:hypothetical protein
MNPPDTSEHTCKSCSNNFVGLYCNLCGEKVLLPSDRKFKSFLANVLIAITFADNKFIKTLWLVVKNPGFLSKEYVHGVRVKYLRPLQLFFILNLIYFLFPVFQLFNASLYTQMYLLPHRNIAREFVLQKISHSNLSLQAYTLMYDAKSQSLAKLLIVVFILLASLPLSLIYRKRTLYFTDHTALAVELACFSLAVNALLLSGIFWTLNTAFNWADSGWIQYLDDLAITIIFVITNTYFLWRASRTFYHQQGFLLYAKVLLALVGLYLSLEVYRLLLFFITYWSV